MAIVNYIKTGKKERKRINNLGQFLNNELPLNNNINNKKQLLKIYGKIKNAINKCNENSNTFISYKSDICFTGLNQKYIEIKKG